MSSMRGTAAPLLLSLCLAQAASAAVVLAPVAARLGVAPLPSLAGLPSLGVPAFSPTLAPALSLSLEGSYRTLSASLLQPGLQPLAAAPRAVPAAARPAAGPRAVPALAARSLPWLPAAPENTLTGDVRFFDFPSRALGGTRRVAVYLPPGYDGSRDRYPVLYVQDGQNVFDARTSFAGVEWGLDEACEALIASGRMRPAIVVAVYNGGERRLDEYTPVPDPQEGGGGAARYEAFLISELKPTIDASLRTRPDAGDTAVLGSSLGGLLALHLSWTRPDVFGAAAALSPSLWWADEEIILRLRLISPLARARLWIDMGTREGGDERSARENLRRLRDLENALRMHGWGPDGDLSVHEVPGAGHNEAAWSHRAAQVLAYLFPPDGTPR